MAERGKTENVMQKVLEARKIMNQQYTASIDDIVEIIQNSNDSFAIACKSFNFGYYQGVMAERAKDGESNG